jgi:hypothetical protein
MVQAEAIVKPSLGLAKGDAWSAVAGSFGGGLPRWSSWRLRGGGANGGAGAIKSPDLREWLTYISSDELEGRAVFTTGFGLAAGYIADHLHAWGVKPAATMVLSADCPRARGEDDLAIDCQRDRER